VCPHGDTIPSHLCAGAAISAAICGYIVTRKIQAYADILKKASESLEARNPLEQLPEKEKGQCATSHAAPVSLVSPLIANSFHAEPTIKLFIMFLLILVIFRQECHFF
jgi:hypothetical protein